MTARRPAGTDRRDGHDGRGGPSGPLDDERGRAIDPRAVRVSLAPASAGLDVPATIVEPPEIPVVPARPTTGRGLLGGVATPPLPTPDLPAVTEPGFVLVDGEPVAAHLDSLDPTRATLVAGEARRRVLFGPVEASGDGRGVLRREVVVDGWRVELELESERRAALRDRARRGREEVGHGGPTEVHAIIPGRVVGVSIAPGEAVVAGQQLLVVEAMKMQNELRAPRDGVVTRVEVTVGVTIEIGDLLLVLE